MNIAVNSRLYQYAGTGIPYSIKQLYTRALHIDKNNKFFFFQTSYVKTIGETYIVPCLNNTLGKILFDLFFVVLLIKKHKIDLFHGPANILPLIKPKRTKYILTIHDLSFIVIPKTCSTFFRIYYKWAVGMSLRTADLVFADSENTKLDILRFYDIDANKIHVLYPGLNEFFIDYQGEQKKLISEPYFFTLATHERRKNINQIIMLMHRQTHLFKDIKLIVAGQLSQEYCAWLKLFIKTHGLIHKVVIFGYATEEQLYSLYANAEFFIYPSLYEGFGLPVIEAIATGCIPLVSNNSSLREVVPYPKLRFDPYSEESIASTISAILTLTSGQKYGLIKGLQTYALRFRWDTTSVLFLKLISALK